MLGARGRELLGELAGFAREQGLLVIADGKRGDIDVTAAAYAGALFGGLDTPAGHIEGLGADAATVNPLMGGDAIEPFLDAARRRGGGVLLLVRTSNPGAADVQDSHSPAAAPSGSISRASSIGSARRASGGEGSATSAPSSAPASRGTWRGRAS